MRNLAIWIVGMVVILFAVGKTPKSEHAWLICEFGVFLWWAAFGVILAVRFLYRFMVRP